MTFDRPIYVIAGPTASGKSSLAIQLAKEINGVIINADSRQIYKELNIGTAKPTPDEIINDNEWIIDGISHFLYGFVSIKDSYNIYKYQRDVQEILDSIPEDKTPILVGGTGLYIDSVVYNYKLDYQPGVKSKERGKALDHRYFVVDIDRDKLRERIAHRVDQMFKEGLLEENKDLFENGLFDNYTILKTIGYQEFKPYFDNEIYLDEVKEKIITNTNRYAKRQRTWFRRNEDVKYIKILEDILKAIS